MLENFLNNLKDIFAADPCAKGEDEQPQQSVANLYEDDDDIDTFFRDI